MIFLCVSTDFPLIRHNLKELQTLYTSRNLFAIRKLVSILTLSELVQLQLEIQHSGLRFQIKKYMLLGFFLSISSFCFTFPLYFFLFSSQVHFFSTHNVTNSTTEICSHFLVIRLVGLLENSFLSFCHDVFGDRIQVLCVSDKSVPFQRLWVCSWRGNGCKCFF